MGVERLQGHCRPNPLHRGMEAKGCTKGREGIRHRACRFGDEKKQISKQKNYHQTLSILAFYTQKCNASVIRLGNTLLCQRLFSFILYFCCREIIEANKK